MAWHERTRRGRKTRVRSLVGAYLCVHVAVPLFAGRNPASARCQGHIWGPAVPGSEPGGAGAQAAEDQD